MRFDTQQRDEIAATAVSREGVCLILIDGILYQ